MAAGQILGRLARVLLGLALGGGLALGLQPCVLGGAMTRVFLGALAGFLLVDARVGERLAARLLLLVGELAQHDAARRGRLGLLDAAGAAVFGAGAEGVSGFAPGSRRVRFFSTTTGLVRPWLKLCLTVDVSVFFSVSVRVGRVESLASVIRIFRSGRGVRTRRV